MIPGSVVGIISLEFDFCQFRFVFFLCLVNFVFRTFYLEFSVEAATRVSISFDCLCYFYSSVEDPLLEFFFALWENILKLV